MRTLLFITAFLVLSVFNSKSQEFLPFASSNYAGITGVQLQPASIADSRYSFDLAFSSTNFSYSNNFYGIDPYVIWHPKVLTEDFDFHGPYISRNLDGQDKSGIITMKQDLFSFMVAVSDKSSIAFTPSFRTIINIDNMTESLAVLIDNMDKETNLWNVRLKNENVYAQMNSWAEYGFTYARVVMDKQEHFLKAGVTMKFIQGMGSGYMFMKDLNYEVENSDTVSLYNTYTNYGITENIALEDFSYQFDANPSLAFDLGIVYEYRPDWMKYKYDMDGKTNIWRRDKDKYLFRIGFTATDLGNTRYKRNPISKDFTADIQNLYIGDINSISELDSLIYNNFEPADVSSNYNMTLPICLSLQADVRVAEGLYVNFTPYLALNRGNNNVNKVHYVSSLNIVPRYDKKWFGLSVPVQYNAYKHWNIGLGLRLGSLWLGWNDMFSMLVTTKNRYGSAVSAIFKIPILYRQPKDIDYDKVSDSRDKCPELAGLYETGGCPDADLDGIPDGSDNCPDIFGLMKFAGCPDTDDDGVIDKEDLCPDVKGLAYFNGCPDSDGDSITDQNDQCPFNAGTIKMAGCPDQDDDGIADKDDNCPTVAGTVENRGCPFIDSDGDGIKDEMDNCPGMKGPVDNNGCPWQDTDNDSIPDKDDDCPSIQGSAIFKGCPDTDNDGISDKYDLCPTLPGIAQNNGCPEIKKEEQDVLNKAFSNLEFETGKSVIRKSSLSSLDELVAVMQKRPEFKLLLAGHTDNVGKPESNLALSKNRTLAVKNYLAKKGIESNRIKAEWYGQTKPIATNDTPEGRQQNRRVEMKIVFE
jgi:outer membrane protein OmpA-like peptidoglycan-associated protein